MSVMVVLGYPSGVVSDNQTVTVVKRTLVIDTVFRRLDNLPLLIVEIVKILVHPADVNIFVKVAIEVLHGNHFAHGLPYTRLHQRPLGTVRCGVESD